MQLNEERQCCVAIKGDCQLRHFGKKESKMQGFENRVRSLNLTSKACQKNI
jgi:hypothetical protein